MQYDLIEEGHHFDTIRARSAEGALAKLTARKLLSSGAYFGYERVTRTIWVRIGAVSVTDPSDASTRKYQLDPKAPPCRGRRAHRWLRGRVQGHGGGVVCTDRCARCGVERVTDTWAQDPTDGEQGLEAVCYRSSAYYRLRAARKSA